MSAHLEKRQEEQNGLPWRGRKAQEPCSQRWDTKSQQLFQDGAGTELRVEEFFFLFFFFPDPTWLKTFVCESPV